MEPVNSTLPNNPEDERVIDVFEQLTSAIKRMNRPLVPPPQSFVPSDKTYRIQEFFVFFELYAENVYGERGISWNQALRSFMQEEARDSLVAMGASDLPYEQVKKI
jgi:hypothetical protein